MYAIINAGGKQYKLKEGDIIAVEKIDANVGDKVSFKPLFVSDETKSVVGKPEVEAASVEAEIAEHGKGEKIEIRVYKKKHGHQRAQGHRQPYTKIAIKKIICSL